MKTRSFLVAAALLAAPASAWAQAGASILDQGRADRAPPSAVPAGPLNLQRGQQAQGPQDAVQPFVLRSVRVEGGTVSAEILSKAWTPYVGRTVGLAEIKELADAVSAAYGDTDVALYTIVTPRQTFQGGVLQLNVIEGYVEDVTVSGDGAGRQVKAYAAKLRKGLPLKRSRLERYLSLMRDIPGVQIDVQLLRGDKPGAVVLAIKAHQKLFEGGLSVNNRGTAFLGQNQIRGDLWFDGLPRQGDQLRLTYATPTDTRRFQYYGAGQIFALGSEGTNLTLSGGYIRTRPNFSPIEGESDTWGVQVSHPLIRGYNKNLYVTGDVDGVDSTNAAFGQTLFTERVRTVRGAVAWTAQTPVQAYSLSSTLSIGVPGLGAQSPIIGWSQTNFTKLNLAGKYSHAIGKSVVVRLDAAGQLTGSRLPGSEQFSLGGDEFGRAFPSAVAIGDQGVAGSVELAYRPQMLPAFFAGSEVYGFTDGGQVTWKSRLGSGGYNQDMSSAGGGVRFAIKSKGVLEVEAANALKVPYIQQEKGWRLTVSVRSLMN